MILLKIGKNLHLIGSSSDISYISVISTQQLQYLPFGELFVEQRDNSNYYSPYKFSAKEKDEETSYSYFGARYLASDFSFWLSVDLMADKYPNISPYAYCAWNPVILVDPDGRDWFENENTGAVYYNNKMSKNDAGTGAMKGEGWKHLGANGMFTKQDGTSSDIGLMGKYGGKISSQNNDGSFNTELMLDGGGKAELFMNDMGYSLVPKEYSYKNDAIVQNFIDEMGNQRIQTIDNGSQISNVYSSQYINNSLYCHETILTIGQEKREILNFNSTRITSTDKIQANYNNWPSLNGTAKQIALEIHSTFGSDIIEEFQDRMIKMFKSNKSKH